jgi:small subunit ribosomal protein S17
MASLTTLRCWSQQLQRCAARASSTTSTTTGTFMMRRAAAVNETATRALAQRYFSDGGSNNVADAAASAVQNNQQNNNTEYGEYNVQDIMRSFDDTSYYDPVDHRPDYSDLTNQELMDTSTIPGWGLIHSPPKEMPRGSLVGTVVSTKMQKTVNVAVNRYQRHKKYRKRIRYTRKFMAHDEAEVASAGDLVMIVPCQHISKHKHFMLREIISAKGQL